MNARERGFLLLSSQLGDPERRPLSAAQLRKLAQTARNMSMTDGDRNITPKDLMQAGCGRELAERIILLLSEEELLNAYLRRGEKAGCKSLTRVSEGYPLRLRKALGLDSPGCLWVKGDASLLNRRSVSLAGSRDIHAENREFAAQAGYQAALQGYVLVSGNARGADRIAQDAALSAGGSVIAVVPDDLRNYPYTERVLYISEDSFDAEFSAQRALSRNHVIHALGECTVIAQCGFQTGGTWNGTVKNLRCGWSPVFCFDDGSDAVQALCQMGAGLIRCEDLQDYSVLEPLCKSFL